MNYYRLNDWLSDECLKHNGSWDFTIPFVGRFVITGDPKNLEHILRTEFNRYEKGPRLHAVLHDLVGDGIFNSDGQHWYVQRKTASMIFNVRNFRDYYGRVFQEHLVMIDRWLEEKLTVANSGTVQLDWHWLMHRFTLQSFCRIGFSLDLHLLDDDSLSAVSAEELTFSDAFDRLQQITDGRIFNPVWPIMERLDGTADKVANYKRVMYNFSSQIIQDRRNRLGGAGQITDDDENADSDLLSFYLKAEADESGRQFTDSELHDMVMNMIIAGRDTTAQLLSWCIVELHQHPSVCDRILQEIRQVLGTDFNPSTDIDQLDYETVTRRLPYTRAVVSECLRLHPSVPKQAKECVVDRDVLPDGTEVRRGDRVTYVSYAMGRSSELWPPDALHFDPERFLRDSQPSPYKFIAFNAGPRLWYVIEDFICYLSTSMRSLGMNLAYMEAVMTLCCFLAKYDINVIDPVESIRYQNALTLPVLGGLQVQIRQRV